MKSSTREKDTPMPMRKALPVRAELAQLLAHATVTKNDAQEVAAEAVKRWKGFIVEAVDEGAGHGEVAKIAGISLARVHAIIAEPSE